jgi:hypothetical protein
MRRGIKVERRGRVTGQPPEAGKVVDPGTNLRDRGQYSKLNCPTVLREELIKQSCSWKAMQLLSSENNSFDHPA